ncbi:tyrosine recombinase XerC [Solimicrobium silvestre]|uniref:Tyrosine recombinase XerC n=1 Tax=Solimicrobium silvestre TaxID=2099400 RepID=A0A2S9H383_9BURK|nr:tyrosine recombinase XerC [Solimicrobium silvestre]PRC94445.1 Site-specific recombinase XerC [Solimicrobium silvestre]
MNTATETTPVLHPDCVSFLAYLRDIRHYSPHTISSYRTDLISLSALFASTPPHQVSTLQIRKLTSQLHSKQLQARSIARHLSCWRSFFSWLSNHTDTEINPVIGIKAPKRSKSLPKALSVDEAVHLVEHALGTSASQAADHAMFELLYSSGLRVSELVNLDIGYCKEAAYTSSGWIDLAEQMVHVTGKGNKVREVPIGSSAITALQHWLGQRPSLLKLEPHALFLTSRGTRMSARLVQLRIKAHAQQLEIKSNVHPHVLRHSFASHVLQSSGDLRAVQELLGHSSLASTQVYTALDFQHLSQVYDAAHPRAKTK